MINYDLTKISTIMFDVDGVLSKNTIQMDKHGNPLRTVNIKDGDSMQLAVKMGLRLVIDYPGYSSGILAKIPFENDPVGFYKWWRKGKHEEKVYLSLGNQVILFQKVAMMDPKMILKKDLEILK